MTALLTPTQTYLTLIADAALAPSSHNSQPWLFRCLPDGVELHADRTRALPVNDPHDRELLISCGAALTNLVESAGHHHLATHVSLFPDDDDPDHLATVHLEPAPTYVDARLAYGIRLRGTWRHAFNPRLVAPTALAQLVGAAEAARAWVHVIDDDERPQLAGLITSGDHFQFSDARWRRQLAAWLHPRRRGDGLHGSAVSRFVVSHLDVGDRVAREDAALTGTAPLVVVLGTDADDELAWLTAGRALQRLLLTAAVLGMHAGFANQPVQVPQLRLQLSSLVGRKYPQLVLRLGYPPEHPTPTPRRPVEDVLIG